LFGFSLQAKATIASLRSAAAASTPANLSSSIVASSPSVLRSDWAAAERRLLSQLASARRECMQAETKIDVCSLSRIFLFFSMSAVVLS
jgi:hypothetical protein